MKNSLADNVYTKIRDSIIAGEVSSREPILEQAVADQYGISKLTAREILQRLCHEKYLNSFPRKGYLISEITPEQCHKIQQVRFQVEAFALRLIVKFASSKGLDSLKMISDQESGSKDPYQTANSRFHLGLAELSGNQYIYDVVYPYIGYIARYAVMGIRYGRFSQDRNYHSEIIDALEAHDIEAAQRYLRLDLQLEESDI
jgi:Transcriptional regulators